MKFLKNFVVATAIVFQMTAFASEPLKQEQWQVMAEKVEQVVDGMGMPIDEGIKEVVIVLNLLGFETRQSCEGHIDHSLPYPWVDFSYPQSLISLNEEMGKYYQERYEAMEKFSNENSIELLWEGVDGSLPGCEYLKQAFDKCNQMQEELDKLQREFLQKHYDLFVEFYKDRSVNYDNTIIMDLSCESNIRYRSMGADFQKVRSPEERAEKLKVYQNEMKEFGNFLKERFFK